MSHTQRGTTRRRSARFIDDDEAPPASKRTKIESGGTKPNAKANGVTEKKKNKPTYDEDDDGFSFARGKTRKAKAAQPPKAATIQEEETKPAAPAAPPARRKRQSISAPEPLQVESHAPSRRRSARLSGDKDEIDEPSEPLPAQPSRRVRRTPVRQVPAPQTEALVPLVPEHTGYDEDQVDFVGAKEPQQLHVAKRRSKATTIPLPFADTPVIKRNKEMRKGSGNDRRRSSSGLRGRRASSLIESGQSTAVPHAQVDAGDFYKHIDQSLPEPRRMKHLLTWCASRAILAKPSGDSPDHSAIMSARAIQQELLDDFSTKAELTDWFDREDTAPAATTKKPNPRNIQISERIRDLEVEIESLLRSERSWKALTSTSSHLPPALTQPANSAPDQISPSLLDCPTQSFILASLTGTPLPPPSETTPQPERVSFPDGTSPSSISRRIQTLTSSLEPTIDTLADGVHKLSQYRKAAEEIADGVLGDVARRVEARDQDVKQRSGTAGVGSAEVLGALGRMLNERR